MSLHDRARIDTQRITSRLSDFGVNCEFLNPLAETCVIACLTSVHHTGFTADGERVNTKQATLSVSMDLLEENNYTYRDSNGFVTFKNHKVVVYNLPYVVREWFPDETVRIITLILGNATN